jgi:hypothetical protein
MRVANAAVAVVLLGLAACATHETVMVSQAPSTPAHSPPAHSAPAHSATAAPRSAAPTPAVTKTVVVTPTAAAPTTAAPAPAAAPAAPNVTAPWAVVSAYYGDIESGDYQNAYALLDSGMTTGQTYQQFADGFSCTGSQVLSENWESGDEVNFDLAATDDCSGAVQDFTGTDTVVNGKIVAADVTADN